MSESEIVSADSVTPLVRTYHVTLEMEIEEDDRARVLGDEHPHLFEDLPCIIHSYAVVVPHEPYLGSIVLADDIPYVRGGDFWYRSDQIAPTRVGVNWEWLSAKNIFVLYAAPKPRIGGRDDGED